MVEVTSTGLRHIWSTADTIRPSASADGRTQLRRGCYSCIKSIRLATIASRIWSAVVPGGDAAHRRAATPVTIGVANDVPAHIARPWVLPPGTPGGSWSET